jgi:hypothetical protein
MDTTKLTPVGWDSETHQFGAGRMAPPMVCATFAYRNEDGEVESLLVSDGDLDGALKERIVWLLTDETIRPVTQNGAYDYAVICATWPDLVPLVFDLLESGRATDTLWREKLLNLSTHGRLKNLPLPDGTSKKLLYNMEALARDYLGLDLSADKGDAEESWRLHYGLLTGWSSDEYPEEAASYAIDDAVHTLEVYEQQTDRAERTDASLETEEFQLLKSFVLQLETVYGIEVNREEAERLEVAVNEVREEVRVELEEVGFLRPANSVGPPYAKDEDRAFELLYEHFDDLPAEIEDWTPYADKLREEGIRFKAPAGTPGSRDTKVIQKYLAALYKRLGEIPDLTPAGAIKCDADVQEYLAERDPVMLAYHRRQELGKLADQMIPVLKSGQIVHPSYDAIKETGRTSAYDGGKGRNGGERLYPSVNIQQIPNNIKGLDARRCFKPRDGRVFIDVDYTALELACVAFITKGLFGESVHHRLYNDGVDLHAYLGAQLAVKDDGSGHALVSQFQSLCREEGILSDPMAIYEAFRALKVHDEKEVQEFFGHFRSFAKPVGLGFPGGLGPATMVTFAQSTYGVTLTEEQAYQFREFWRETYPEMLRFFDVINASLDDRNLGEDQRYEYVSPMGMVRRGATFCAASNGRSMQTPGAEAAMTGTALVTRACYDPTQESVLYGCRPVAFIHDQVLVETTEDQDLWAAQAEETKRLMIAGAEMVLDGVKMRCDDALLTTTWTKAAKPTFDDNGVMIPWTPS